MFASDREYHANLGNVDYWSSWVAEALRRHDLDNCHAAMVAGFNATYPTFLCDDVVVKFFGFLHSAAQSHANERAAHMALAAVPEVSAPALLGDGRLFEDPDEPWPYLITSRVAGSASCDVELTLRERRAIAMRLGEQVRCLHRLSPQGVAVHDDWLPIDMTSALQASSLPHHLVQQADDFIARLAPFDRTFVHGDLCANHVFIDDGRVAGIIDWGDALVTDRHYELIQLYRDMFDCDKALFRVFLDASDWPVTPHFPHQTLGLALYRQAIGLAQHRTMDVFEPIAARYPFRDIATLDELALALFRV